MFVNNKGFAVTTMVFGLVILASLVLFGTLVIFNRTKTQSDSFTDSVETELHSNGVNVALTSDEYNNEYTFGTEGKARELNRISIELVNPTYSGSIEYQAYFTNTGWESEWHSNGEICENNGNKIEAIKIKLTGDMSNYYNVYYRSHVQNVGWMKWAENGNPSGSQNKNYRLEAFKIVIIKKGESVPAASPLAIDQSFISS